MKNLLSMAKNLILKVLKTVGQRLKEAGIYFLKLAINVGISLALMPNIALITFLIMKLCGVSEIANVGGGSQQIFEAGTPWPVVLITMLMVGLAEESFFRYIVMHCLYMRWLKMPYALALVLSSASFGIAHLANAPWQISLPQAVGAGFLGLFLARVYRKQGLHMCIATHGLYNFIICMIQGI